MKGQLIGKDLDAEKDGGQEEKGATENEMVGWHHLLMNVNLSKLSGEQRRLACCKELDMTL